MTASKPEVVGYFHSFMVGDEFKVSLSHFTLQPDAYKSVFGDECEAHPVIWLTDHEAVIADLQADRDQQYDMKVKAREQRDAVTSARAADKARIAELEAALAGLLSSLTDEDGLLEHVEPVINARAALSQQGKEGET